jgi:hypothetical protein
VANIAKELVGAKYIELLSTITWIRREAYAVHVAYRGIRFAKEKPVAGYQVERLVRWDVTWEVLGKMQRSQKPWRSAEEQRDANEINGVVSTTAAFRLIKLLIPIHMSLHDGGIQSERWSSLLMLTAHLHISLDHLPRFSAPLTAHTPPPKYPQPQR